MTVSVVQPPTHLFIDQVAMPDGTYILRSAPDGQHWSVQLPSSDTWFDGFVDRLEACRAIVYQTLSPRQLVS